MPTHARCQHCGVEGVVVCRCETGGATLADLHELAALRKMVDELAALRKMVDRLKLENRNLTKALRVARHGVSESTPDTNVQPSFAATVFAQEGASVSADKTLPAPPDAG